jgi:hypothetical protein
VASSTVCCEITFELARHDFKRTFTSYVICVLLIWCSVHNCWMTSNLYYSGTTYAFTLTHGIIGKVETMERRPECLLTTSCKVLKLMRKTRRKRGRKAVFYVINTTPAAEQPAELHIGGELPAKERQYFRTLLHHDFPELLQP